MIYCIDIDGTLCSREKDYNKALPCKHRIRIVNKLYGLGHKIILFTGRGTNTGIDWRKITEKQLSKWQVKYHELRFKQFCYDYLIDDRACNAVAFFGELAKFHLHREKYPFINELAFLVTGYDLYGKAGTLKWM